MLTTFADNTLRNSKKHLLWKPKTFNFLLHTKTASCINFTKHFVSTDIFLGEMLQLYSILSTELCIVFQDIQVQYVALIVHDIVLVLSIIVMSC